MVAVHPVALNGARRSASRPVRTVLTGALPAVVALVLVTACGSADGAASGSSPSVQSQEGPTSGEPAEAPTSEGSTASTENAGAGQRIEVTVTGDEVTPPPGQVDLGVGDTLTLVVTSDRDSEVHAHGFEVDAPAPAGTPTEVQLTGTQPGVYEVELHDPDLLLMQVAVR